MGTPVLDALQNVLTKGLDAAAQYKTAQLQVTDPAGYVVGPNGQRVPAGTGGSFATQLSALPSWVWLAGLGLVGALVLIPLVRR